MVRTRTQHFVLAASSVLSVPKWILRHRSRLFYRWKRKLNGNRLNKIAVEAFTLNLIRKNFTSHSCAMWGIPSLLFKLNVNARHGEKCAHSTKLLKWSGWERAFKDDIDAKMLDAYQASQHIQCTWILSQFKKLLVAKHQFFLEFSMHLRALLTRRSMSRLFSLFEPSRANCFKSTRTGFKLRFFFLVIAEFSSTVSFQILCFKFIVAGMSRRSLLTCLVVLMAVTCEELRKFAF